MDTTTISRPHANGRRLLLAVALVAALALNLAPMRIALAAAPSNDNLANAKSITPPLSNDTIDTTSATRDSGEVGGGGGTCNFPLLGNTHSVWYKYTPSGNGWLTLDTFGSNYDTVLEVFSLTGPPPPTFGALSSIACNDDSANTSQSALTLQASSGTNYYIVVRSFGTTAGGTLKFSASFSSQHNIYVNQSTGNDANPGTAARPVKTIQQGVNLAFASGSIINIVTAGTYAESVTIGKNLTLKPTAGAVTANSFTLASGAIVALAGSPISAPSITVQAGARIPDGVVLASAGGTVSVGNGTFAQNVTIGKALTLRSTTGATIQPASGYAITVNAAPTTLTGLNITSSSGVTNTTATAINAINNYWNSPSGPTSASNPGGTGASAGAKVNFRPWCTNPQPTCGPVSGLATKLVFTTSPTDSNVGLAFPIQPVVAAQDAVGRTDTSFNSPITLAIKANTGTSGAQLLGTVTVNASSGVATFSGLSIDKVGTAYQLTATSGNLTSGDSTPFDIGKGDQTITFNSLPDRSFDQSPFTVSATASSGLSVTFSASGNCNVSGNTVTLTSVGPCTITASQAGDANWNAATPVQQTFTITKGNQTINFASLPDVPFNTPDFDLSASATSGLTVTFIVSGQCTLSGNTVHVTGIGSCSVTASQAGNSNWNAAPDVTQTFNITKANATVTLSNLTYTYDGNQHAATATTNPVSLTVVLTYTGATYGPTQTPPTNAGNYTVDAVVNDSNYQGSATATLTINRANATVTLSNLNFTYDGSPHAATATTTPANRAVEIRYNGSLTPPTNAGSYSVVATITDPNYQGSATATLTINKANATVTLSNLNHTYDGTPKTATATANQTVDAISITYNSSPRAPTNAGSYAVVATIVDDNYQGSATGTLVIAKASQTITFGALANKLYGDPDFTISATASSGVAVAFSASGNCTITGATVHITGAGSCTITASQPGDANHTAAASVARTFAIGKGNQAISFGLLADRSIANPTFAITATASSKLAVVFSAAGQCSVSGTTVTLTALGSCTITASQPGDANWNAATPVTRTFQIVDKFSSYMPMLQFGPKPDLTGSFSLTPNSLAPNSPVSITVTITNRGTSAASEFWVDFYINPSTPPTDTNQRWDTLCSSRPCYGIAWYVRQTIEPGQSITLTSTPDSYYGPNTIWRGAFAEGTKDLYLYVDSWNPGVATGAVDELDETNNRAEYHGQPTSAAIGAPIGAPATPDALRPDDLPPRPVRP
jgi:MBG domain/CARDB